MDPVCLVMPILPGKTADARAFLRELEGPRKSEFDQSERRIGITKELWYLATLPTLLVNFAAFFSFSALLAVTTRNAVACVIGSVMFWLLCVAMNLGRHWALTTPEMGTWPPSFQILSEIGYWVLPKPADMGIFLTEALRIRDDFAQAVDLPKLIRADGWRPALSLLSSLLAALGLFWLAAREFVTTDY